MLSHGLEHDLPLDLQQDLQQDLFGDDAPVGRGRAGGTIACAEAAGADHALLALALRSVPHGICLFDDHKRLVLCNPAYAALYALPPELTRRGVTLQSILDHRAAVGNAPAELDSYFDLVVEADRRQAHASSRVPLQDGRYIQITHNPLRQNGYLAVHEDVTAHVMAEERIRRLATRDYLTGIWNRPAFYDRLESLDPRGRGEALVAVHCLDLDHFKAVNDTLGHHAGDLLLRMVTQRFLACLREADVVARLGGDEFAILQRRISRPEQAGQLASRLIEAVAQPFDLGGPRVAIGVSVGIAVAAPDTVSPDELLRDADVALYRAKSDGRNTFRFFELPPGPAQRFRPPHPAARARSAGSRASGS